MDKMMMENKAKVDEVSKQIDEQIDEVDARQNCLIEQNNQLYKDVEIMKVKITLLKSKRDTMKSVPTLPTTKIPRMTSPHMDKSPIFMDTHPIDTRADNRHPISTPSQFIYPENNHHVKEV